MILKRPALAFSAYNTLVASNSTGSSSISTSSVRRAGPRRTSRGYATVKDDVRPSGPEWDFVDLWPEPLHPHKIPTPYQILQIRRGDRYTKARFTELVKLYHPDRSDHPSHIHLCRSIPQHIRLERYRLIIAAHSILSDPAKRSAYDTFGAGWGQFENVTMTNGRGNHVPTYGPDSPMGNATWEDWERWYRRRDQEAGNAPPPPPQSPVFLSNTAFVSLVVMLAALGGIGQATRADASTKNLLQLRDETHQRAADELAKVRVDAMNWTKDERIAMFLRTRDPQAYHDESLRKMILDPDICDNGAPRHREADFKRNYKESNFGVKHSPDEAERMAEPPRT